VPSLPNDDSVTHDDGADHRVRRRLSPSPLGQRESPTHVRAVTRLVQAPAGVGHRDQKPMLIPAEKYVRASAAAAPEKALNVVTFPPETCPASATIFTNGRLKERLAK